MNNEMRVAVLIDAENIPSKYADTILQEATRLGNVIIKRIYGNWTMQNMSSWKKQILEYAIHPIQQFSNTTGKNSSDSALIIDAMDLLYEKDLDAFCIVSSDSDFTRLASRLRESEKYVLGMGEQKTPRSFISTCNKFAYLDLLQKDKNNSKEKKEQKQQPKAKQQANKSNKQGQKTPAENTPKQSEVLQSSQEQNTHSQNEPETTISTQSSTEANMSEQSASNQTMLGLNMFAQSKAERFSSGETTEENSVLISTFGYGSDIDQVSEVLRDLSEDYCREDGWILSSTLGALLAKQLPDFDTRNFGFKKFVPFIDSLGIFESKSVAPKEDPSSKTVFFRIIEE